MIRIAIAAALLAAPAVPAFAQATVGVTHHEAGGPASGRSPHKAYRQIAASPADCRVAPIHVPAGKLPHYGAHQVAGTCDTASGLAAADGDRTVRRD
jgi:hypothetical protein